MTSLLFALLLAAPPAPPTCHLQVIPDYTLFGLTYRAVLRPSPGCAYGTTLRVRKSSTLNVKRNGAPYQPILPEVGAWEIGVGVTVKNPVPAKSLWTLSSWRWEWWNPDVWNPRTGQRGRWLAAEVLHATP